MAILTINRFSGGLADSLYSGINGSFANGSKGVDIHSVPGLLQAQQKLTKNSGSTVTDLVLWTVQSTDGSTYFFGDAGKIYKRTSAGTWSVVRDEGERICGAIEYNGKFYWAENDLVNQMAIAGNWTTDVSTAVTWTSAEVDTNWHPMVVSPAGTLSIGAGQYITTINSAGTVTNQALDLPIKWVVKCLGIYGDYLLIGASYNNATINISAIYKWDTYSDSFLTPQYLSEPSIDFITSQGSSIIVGAGNNGLLYQYTLNDFVIIKRIPGTYTSSALSTFNPDAAGYFNGVLLFGVSNNTGNPSTEGVYSWGSPNKNYPKVLSLDYPISTGTTATISIGSIKAAGTNCFVSWKDGSSYGVDMVDFSSKLNSSVWQSVAIGGSKPTKIFKRFCINCEPLAASTSFTLKTKTNRETSFQTMTDTQAGAYSTASGTTVTFDQIIIGETLELQITFTTSSNSTPKINSIQIEYDLQRNF